MPRGGFEVARVRPGRNVAAPTRAAGRTHGAANWLPDERLTKLFDGPDRRWGGLPIGEAYRPPFADESVEFDEENPATWAGGGRAELLLTRLARGAIHWLIFAGSGAYKTMGFVVPSCATWFGSLVIMDPSCQVGPMTRDLRRQMGHRVVEMSLENAAASGMNVLDRIDIDAPTATIQLEEFVNWCRYGGDDRRASSDSENGEFFSKSAFELECCLLADLLWDPSAERTVAEWRRRMTIPEKELPKRLMHIYAHSNSSFARELAGTIMTLAKTADRTWGGIYKHMTTEMGWLSNPAIATLLSVPTFDPTDLIRGRMTVYLQIDEDVLSQTPQVAQVIIGTLLRTVLRARGKTATPIPFILDEARFVIRLPIISTVRDLGRRSRIALVPIFQGVSQLEDALGEKGKRSWYASVAGRIYAAVNDEETARELAARCGKYTAISRSEGTNLNGGRGSRSRGTSDTVSETAVPLLDEYEVQTRLRPDAAILVPRGLPVAIVGRPLWWRRPEMARFIKQDSYRSQGREKADSRSSLIRLPRLLSDATGLRALRRG